MGPSRTKLQALSVVIYPRIWELEHQGVTRLDDKVIKRAEIAYDELVNKIVEDEKRSSVNKTWYALKLARDARLNPGGGNDIFTNVVKISRSNIIGPWKWWSTYAGSSNVDFVQDIARVVLNIRCNASATERVNSMYKHVIGIARVRMNNDRAEKLVYAYVNSRSMKSVREHQRELVLAEAKGTPLFGLPELHFDNTQQEPHVYGSLGHDNLTSIGVDAFDANDHVHELRDVIEGRGVPGREDDIARTQCGLSSRQESPSSSTSHSAEQNEEGDIFTDDDMELSPAAEREID